MKKVALLTVLLVVAASAAITITFPSGDPTTVGVPVRVIITSDAVDNVDLFVNPGQKTWAYPTEVDLTQTGPTTFEYDDDIEITHPGTNLTLFASKGIENGESDTFDVVVGNAVKWQILAPGEVSDPGLATDTTGKHGSASVTAGDPENYTINICDKWWNPATGTQTPSLETTDPFGYLPATPVVGGNSIELRTAPGSPWDVTVSGSGLTEDTSRVKVNAGPVTQLLLLCSGESHLPGDDTISATLYPGKSGEPDAASMGTQYKVTVLAVDKCWNQVTTYNGTGNVTIKGTTQGDITATPKPISGGKVDLGAQFKAPNAQGEFVSASEAGGKQTSYDTKVIVLPGVTSVNVSLDRTLVPPGVEATLKAEPKIGDQPVGGTFPVYVELLEDLTTGNPDSFHADSVMYTDVNGVASEPVSADTEGVYYIKVSAGNIDSTVVLTVKELEELLVAPNPFKSGSPGHDEIKFIYKVAQAGAAEVLLLIADPYGNIVYKETHTSGEVVSPGQQEISWDGTNSKGNRIASGMYQAVVKVTLTNLSTEVLKKNFMVIW